MSKILSDIAEYVTDKVDCSSLTSETYIGMDNLIPNKGGRTISEHVPEDGTTIAYKKGDILLGNIRPYFKKIWLAENDGGCSPDVLCIRAKNGISSLFLYAVLAQDSFFDYDVKGAKGSKMPRGDKDHIMAFPVPELDKKDEIGKLIDGIYKIIQNNTAICSDLEAMAKLLYDYWFVQFDFPDENGKPYKSSGGKMVWNEELKRDIPDGWEVSTLRKKYRIERGISYSSKDIESGQGMPMINLACIDTKRNYRDGELKYYDGNISDDDILSPFDLLIACTDLTRNADIVGSPILTPNDGKTYTFSTDIAKLIPNETELNPIYLYMTLRTEYYHNYIKKWASGTNVLHLDLTGLDWYKMWFPPKSLQDKFAETILQFENKKFKTMIENRELTSLRDFLLPMLMNGQVKIGGADS